MIEQPVVSPIKIPTGGKITVIVSGPTKVKSSDTKVTIERKD